MRLSALTLLVTLMVAGLLGGCGIPLDNESRDLTVELPDALLPVDPSISAASTPIMSEVETVQIYLAQMGEEGRVFLKAVEREIQGDGSINVILAEVFAGPSPAEQESELISPFAQGSSIVGTVLEAGLLQIHLDSLDGFPQDDSTGNRLAFAMLVCTAVDLVVGADIEQVAILLDGESGLEAINVPVSDGEPPVEGAPVTCSNYVSFLE